MPSKALKVVLRTANSVHVGLYRITGGRFANRVAGMPVLLLTTFGSRTGIPHTNPVVFLNDGDNYLVSTSYPSQGGRWRMRTT